MLAALANLRLVALARVFLGALFVTVFYDNLSKHLYTAGGYAHLVNGYAARNNAPGFWKDAMGFLADHGNVLAPAQGAFELVLGLLLVAGVAAAAAALVAGGFVTALWISELGIFWVWELLSVMLIAVLVGLATLPQLLGAPTVAERLLGPRTFGALGLGKRLALAVLGAVALYLAAVAAQTGGPAHDQTIGLRAGLTFGLLLALRALLDERLPVEPPRSPAEARAAAR